MFLRMRAFGSRLWSVHSGRTTDDLCQNTIHVRAHLHFHIPTLEYIEKAIHKLPTERPGERTSRTSPGPHAHLS